MQLTPESPLALEQLAGSLAATAYQAYSHALPGQPGTNAHRFWEWTTRPRVGQLVVEVSTHGLRPAIERLGVLQSITDEPVPNWEESLNGPAPQRPVWTIQLLNGELKRWENCRFIAVPRERDLQF